MAFLLAKPTPHNVNHDNDRFSMFNKKRDIPACDSQTMLSPFIPQLFPTVSVEFETGLTLRMKGR
jgi:hypothetical protein